MKKIILFSFFLFLFSLTASSQYEVEWGPVYKSPRGLFSYTQLIGLYGNNYFVLSHSKRENTLLKYDLNHKLVSTKSLEMKYEKEKISFNKIITTSKGRFAYLPQVLKKQDEWRLLIAKFDNGNFGKIKEVFKHDFRVKRFFLGARNFNRDNLNSLVISDDKNKVAYSNITSMKEGKEESVAIAVFNAEMELEWSKFQMLDYKDKQVLIEQTVVDNKGEVYILAKVSDKAKKISKKDRKQVKKSKSLPKFSYKIFHVTKDKMQEIDINIGSTIAPVDATLFFPKGDDGQIILAGFYTDAERKSKIKGLFYASGNKKEGITSHKSNEFEKDFLEGLATKKDIRKDRGISNSFKINDFMQYSDGTVGFIAEQYYVTSHTTTDSKGRMKTYYIYHSDNILLPKFSTDGTLLNIQKISKSYSSRSSSYCSYSASRRNGKLFLIFNDYKNKKERKELKGKRRWIYTDMVVIEEDGKISYNETIFNSDEVDSMGFIPSNYDYDNNNMIISVFRRKKYRYGTIKLK